MQGLAAQSEESYREYIRLVEMKDSEQKKQAERDEQVQEMLGNINTPCPFCGKIEPMWWSEDGLISIQCAHCGCQSPGCHNHEETVDIWNGSLKR